MISLVLLRTNGANDPELLRRPGTERQHWEIQFCGF
jgi:hypothetical protein